MMKLISALYRRWKSLLVAYNVSSQVLAKPKLRCGLNAIVFNHGSKGNIELGEGVVLDGVLECYDKGKLRVGNFTYIGRSRIFAAESVTIGKGVYISDFVVIFDSNLHSIAAKKRYADLVAWNQGKFPDVYTNVESKPVRIADYAWVGALCVIGKGAVIGEGAIVGAGSVVTKEVPAYTVVAGNPAQIIRELARDES